MVNSCWLWQKSNQYCKAIINQLKINLKKKNDYWSFQELQHYSRWADRVGWVFSLWVPEGESACLCPRPVLGYSFCLQKLKGPRTLMSGVVTEVRPACAGCPQWIRGDQSINKEGHWGWRHFEGNMPGAPQGGHEQFSPTKGEIWAIIKEMFTQLIREKVRKERTGNPARRITNRKGPGREGDASVNVNSQNWKGMEKPNRTKASGRKMSTSQTGQALHTTLRVGTSVLNQEGTKLYVKIQATWDRNFLSKKSWQFFFHSFFLTLQYCISFAILHIYW